MKTSGKRDSAEHGADGSYEAVFHDIGIPRCLLLLHKVAQAALPLLRKPRLQQAIGVVYWPRTERTSHYFYTRLADQFDVILHCDEPRAVKALDMETDAEIPADVG